MQKSKKEKSKLGIYLDSLSYHERGLMRQKLAKACFVNPTTVDNWRNRVEPHPLAQKVINEVLGVKIYDIEE